MARLTIGTRTYEVEVKGDSVIVDGIAFAVTVKDDGAHKTVRAGEINYRVQLPAADQRQSGMEVLVDYRPFVVEYEGRLSAGAVPPPRKAPAAAAVRPGVKGGVVAQIAGKVLRLVAAAGDTVKQGDVLLILEAMKMENEIKSPANGTVKEIPVTEGQRVSEGDTLAIVE
ncbi:MAG: biotin/lipoyl-containing protein [Dehalococcoidia bacterium]